MCCLGFPVVCGSPSKVVQSPRACVQVLWKSLYPSVKAILEEYLGDAHAVCLQPALLQLEHHQLRLPARPYGCAVQDVGCMYMHSTTIWNATPAQTTEC